MADHSSDPDLLAQAAAELTAQAVGMGRPALADPCDASTLVALAGANMRVFDAREEPDMPALESALTWAAALQLQHSQETPSWIAELLEDADPTEVLDDGLDIWLDQANGDLRRWRAEGDETALVHAELLLRCCLAACGPGHRNRFVYAGNLAIVLRAHHARSSDPAWIDAATRLARAAVQDGPRDPQHAAGLLTNLSITLLDAFDATGDTELMTEALQAARQAADMGGSLSTDDRVLVEGNLIAALLRYHEETDDVGALREAVERGEHLLSSMPAGHVSAASVRSNVAVGLAKLADELSEPDLARRSLALAVQAVQEESHPLQRVRFQANVCVVARIACSIFGDDSYLRLGIEHGRAALALIGPTAAASAGLACNLANLLRELAQRTGDLAYLDEASEVLRDVLAVIPDGHPDVPLLHGAAAGLAFARYEHTGELAYARRGVELLRAVVGLVPANRPLWKTIMADLSGLLHVLFLRTDDVSHLNASIDLAHAVLAVPTAPRTAANLRANLGATLQMRFLLRADLADLEAAVAEGEAALELLPAWAAPPGHRHNLSNSVRYLAHATGDPALWRRAVELSRTAVEASAPGSPQRATFLVGLANALAEAPGADASARQEAVAALEEAVAIQAAAPMVRVRAARSLADLYARDGRWSRAGAVLAEAVALLRQVAPWHLARHDQERHLARVAGLGPDAAAAELMYSSPARAVEVIEHARGVLFSYGITELEPDLGPAHADLARRLRQTRAALQAILRRVNGLS